MKNSICFLLLLALTPCFSQQVFGQRPNQTKVATPTQGNKPAVISAPGKADRNFFDTNLGYMNYQGKTGRDTANAAFALGVSYGRRMVAKPNFTFESLGNFDVIQFTAASAGNEITKRLGGSTLFNPQFGFRLTNGQLTDGKKVAFGLKFSGGVAANVQSFLKFDFKGVRPDLTLAASPSVAIMLGGGKFVGCQLDLAYIGQSNGISAGLQKGFFVTPRFTFQL